jgi:hypothetical protein
MLEVSVIDVRVNTEKPFEDDLYDVQEIFGEGDTQSAGENFFVIQLVLNPCHQEVDVFLGGNFQGSLNIVTISP